MDVTVAICTWNRAELLDCALRSLADVEIPRHVNWRVIVADNNSTDGTSAVLDRHEARLPLQRLFVKDQGKSHALNAVTERLQGDLVLWTDDDVLLDRRWLAAHVEVAEKNPQVGFFGGKIIPCFLGGEPDWLRPAWKYSAELFAVRDFGDEPFLLSADYLPYGANWAVRVPLQKQYSYNVELGRRGELMYTGEETDVALRMLADGHQGLWVPQSSVEHLVTPERVEIDALWRHYFSYALHAKKRAEALPRRIMRGGWHVIQAYLCQSIAALYSFKRRYDSWLRFTMYSGINWGFAEIQWRDFPHWLKPGALRTLLQKKHQPRFAKSLKPLIDEAYRRHGAKHSVPQFSDRRPAPLRRAA